MRLSLIQVLPVHGCFFPGIHIFWHIQRLALVILNCSGKGVSSASSLTLFYSPIGMSFLSNSLQIFLLSAL